MNEAVGFAPVEAARDIVPAVNRLATAVCEARGESSARDADMMNFRMGMVSDGNAALSQEEHDASLSAFYNAFGDVMDTDMIVAVLRRPRFRPGALALKIPLQAGEF
jgi:hypothetical protein